MRSQSSCALVIFIIAITDVAEGGKKDDKVPEYLTQQLVDQGLQVLPTEEPIILPDDDDDQGDFALEKQCNCQCPKHKIIHVPVPKVQIRFYPVKEKTEIDEATTTVPPSFIPLKLDLDEDGKPFKPHFDSQLYKESGEEDGYKHKKHENSDTDKPNYASEGHKGHGDQEDGGSFGASNSHAIAQQMNDSSTNEKEFVLENRSSKDNGPELKIHIVQPPSPLATTNKSKTSIQLHLNRINPDGSIAQPYVARMASPTGSQSTEQMANPQPVRMRYPNENKSVPNRQVTSMREHNINQLNIAKSNQVNHGYFNDEQNEQVNPVQLPKRVPIPVFNSMSNELKEPEQFTGYRAGQHTDGRLNYELQPNQMNQVTSKSRVVQRTVPSYSANEVNVEGNSYSSKQLTYPQVESHLNQEQKYIELPHVFQYSTMTPLAEDGNDQSKNGKQGSQPGNLVSLQVIIHNDSKGPKTSITTSDRPEVTLMSASATTSTTTTPKPMAKYSNESPGKAEIQFPYNPDDESDSSQQGQEEVNKSGQGTEEEQQMTDPPTDRRPKSGNKVVRNKNKGPVSRRKLASDCAEIRRRKERVQYKGGRKFNGGYDTRNRPQKVKGPQKVKIDEMYLVPVDDHFNNQEVEGKEELPVTSDFEDAVYESIDDDNLQHPQIFDDQKLYLTDLELSLQSERKELIVKPLNANGILPDASARNLGAIKSGPSKNKCDSKQHLANNSMFNRHQSSSRFNLPFVIHQAVYSAIAKNNGKVQIARSDFKSNRIKLLRIKKVKNG